MSRRWTQQELEQLKTLSRKYPNAIIAKKMNRSITSVRYHLRNMNINAISQKEWKEAEIRQLIETGAQHHAKKSRSTKKSSSSPVLDDFWKTLLGAAKLAKLQNKKMDIANFINTYRKLNMK